MDQSFALFTALQVTSVLVVFARLGMAMMLMPGFGDRVVLGRHRLVLALLLSAMLAPAAPVTPPAATPMLALLLAREALIGAFIGLAARIVFTALYSLGALVAAVSSLSNAMSQGQQDYEGSTVVTTLLMMSGTALIFATDTHHIMLLGLFTSYEILPPTWLPLGDLAQQITRFVAHSSYLSVMIGAPFLLLAVVLNLGLGLANRVMPQMPVFFVAGPAMILLGLITLYLCAPAILTQFITQFGDVFKFLRADAL